MGHKYRRKNQHRKRMRLKKRASSGQPLFNERIMDSMRDYYLGSSSIWGTAKTSAGVYIVGEQGPEAVVRGEAAKP